QPDVPLLPKFSVEKAVVAAEAERADVVGQRVEPDVDGLPRMAREGDAPFQAGPRDGQVAQAGFDERADLVEPGGRTDGFRMRVVPVEERLLVLRQPEEDVLLGLPLDGRAV